MVKTCCAIACALSVVVGCSGSSSSPGASPGFGNAGTSGGGGGSGSSTAGVSANDPNAVGAGCATDGEKRVCCENGTQLCSGSQEFLTWGPCINDKGMELTCTITDTGKCEDGEFGPNCDKLPDAGDDNKCEDGEFGPNCTPMKFPPLCKDRRINNEPEIFAAYSPMAPQSVSKNGQIKVWINDERPQFLSKGEIVDPVSGKITTPGDRTGKAPDGYLWEPALYIAPDTAESGGTPHFPQAIKGWSNNDPPNYAGRDVPNGVNVPGMDSAPAGTSLPEMFTSEDIWEVSELGLAPGTYIAEFVVYDGDRDRGVSCVTIQITE